MNAVKKESSGNAPNVHFGTNVDFDQNHGFGQNPWISTKTMISMDFQGFPWIFVKIDGNPSIPLPTALNPAIGDVSDTRWWCSERFYAHW